LNIKHKSVPGNVVFVAFTPHNPASKLRGFKNVYKIKLRPVGYRLAYEVNDLEVVVYVIAIGKRERGLVYAKAEERK